MITVDPERPRKQSHDSRKRPRERPSPKLDPQFKPTAKRRRQETPSASASAWFTIRDILDERKTERGRTLYLIDWDGTDQNGQRFDPTWEPAANVTAAAISAWRKKKDWKDRKGKAREGAIKAADAPSRSDGDSSSPESTPGNHPVQVPGRRREQREKSELRRRDSDDTHAALSGNNGDEARKYKTADLPPSRSPSRLQLARAHLGGRLSAPATDQPETGNPNIDDRAQTRPVAKPQGAQIVVELPLATTLDPSEFQIILSSQSSQGASQVTLSDRMRLADIARLDQRVIPDSQEISGTSASEAHSSHHIDSQFSGHPPVLPGLSESSQQASLSSGIPSHQIDSRFGGVSAFLANPNLSTNLGVSTGTNQNQSPLHINPTGPFQGSINESSLVFETQLEADFSIVTATSPATSLQQHPELQASQEAGSQHSHTTNRASTPSHSQAAQIVQPLSSHPAEATSQSQSDFSVFGGDRTVPETVPSQLDAEADFQESSQALSELDGNIRISRAYREHELTSSVASYQASQSVAPGTGDLDPRCAVADLSQGIRPVTPHDMDGASPAEMPLSAKEKLRLFREGRLNKPSTESTSPAASSPVPFGNATTHVAPNVTAQKETHVDSRNTAAADLSTPLISPLLPLTPGVAQVPAELLIGSEQPPIGGSPPREHVRPLSLNTYAAPQAEQPATLDPSRLTLSIEEDVAASPSVPTDDGFLTGPPPLRSTDSDEDEMQADDTRSYHFPPVPTGASEYLITLPFQPSSRPQYNDIIRENEGLMNEYNHSFRVFPHKTPQKDVIEKLDMMFSRLFDICDFPPFLDSLASMSPEQTTKHVIGTNAKFSFVAELLDNLLALNSDKKLLILVRPGKLMDLLGYVIQSRECHYIRSGQEVVSAVNSRHPLTVALSSTSDGQPPNPVDVDAVIAFDHTFRQELVSSTGQNHTPIVLTLVNVASIQHLNMCIMENLQSLERKNVLMLALAKAMRYVEEPDPSESLFSIAERFATRIQIPEHNEDDFYWEPQSVPTEIFDDLYAGSSQIDATQLSGPSLDADQHPDSRKRSHVEDDDNDESLRKRPKMSQPPVVTSFSHISDIMRNLLGDNLALDSEKVNVVVPLDKLQALSEKFAELESQLKESKSRENEFRQLSDRAQKEVNSYVSSINNIQTRYMEALQDRGIFEADCKIAQEQASVLGNSLESCRTEIATLKATRTELEKKLATANDALLHSSTPDLVKLAELDRDLNKAKADVQRLENNKVVMQSDTDYMKNKYTEASQRATELAAENRGLEKTIEELRRKADENVVEVNRVQSRNELRILTQQLKEQKSLVREHVTELNRVREELKSAKSGRRETRQSSVPRSPRLSLGVMSPRNGPRGPSAMGGPSSSRGTSPQPPPVLSDGPVGAGNGVQNAAIFGQGSVSNRFAHLRDQRF
ncbi:hypothetical protein F5Y14DRAFT_403425 [Nemania sp. NC0429]|nr:hypothetical protein F5Y14DRAFT_403425 [Nemania sp. NC0429]